MREGLHTSWKAALGRRLALGAVIALFLLAAAGSGWSKARQRWLPPLAVGWAPECSKHPGLRRYRSETAQFGTTTAFILGETRRDAGGGCRSVVELHVRVNGRDQTYRLGDKTEREFSTVDFSPDGSRLLLFNDSLLNWGGFPNSRVGTLKLGTHELKWETTQKILGWSNCDGAVGTIGFASDGGIVMEGKPDPLVGHPLPDCVASDDLFSVQPQPRVATRLPEDIRVQRYGKTVEGPSANCDSDPDLVAACFVVHGRLSFYNGNPTARIWKIGTHRMLGVHESVLPGALGLKMNWNIDAYGNFYVCPFAKEKPGVMQFVCVQGARHVIYEPTR